MIELDSEKYEDLSEHVEDALRCMGKVMQYIETMKNNYSDTEDSELYQRRNHSYKNDYDNDYRTLKDERINRSSGRYSRY